MMSAFMLHVNKDKKQTSFYLSIYFVLKFLYFTKQIVE